MDRSVFISYSHQDGEAVRRDADLLRAGGVLVFIDVRDIAYGERWRDVLRESLLRCERVLVFWSAAARVSEWVDREWRFALELGKKIVPTLLDPTPLPTELAAFQVVRRFEAPPPRRQQHTRIKIAASALFVAGAGSVWWLHEGPSHEVQPTPAPLPTASAPAPDVPAKVVPAPPPNASAPAPSPPPVSIPGPVPGPQPPWPPPAPAPAPSDVSGALGFVGGMISLVLALLLVQYKARRQRPADAQHTATGAVPDAEARRFVEAVFSA